MRGLNDLILREGGLHAVVLPAVVLPTGRRCSSWACASSASARARDSKRPRRSRPPHACKATPAGSDAAHCGPPRAADRRLLDPHARRALESRPFVRSAVALTSDGSRTPRTSAYGRHRRLRGAPVRDGTSLANTRRGATHAVIGECARVTSYPACSAAPTPWRARSTARIHARLRSGRTAARCVRREGPHERDASRHVPGAAR